MEEPIICHNESLYTGFCTENLPICGFCYDFGQFNKPSPVYEFYNMMVIGIIMPTISVFGLIGNCLSALVYSRKSMRSSLNLYLCVLAFSDATIITTSFFLFFLESLRKKHQFASKLFAIASPLMFPFGLTAQSLSVFLTVSAAFDCFVLVIGSDNVKEKICSINSSKYIIGATIILAVLFNLPHLFEIRVEYCYSTHFKTFSYDVCPTALRQNEVYYTFYYAYAYTIFMGVAPVLLLIILNSAIVVIMKQNEHTNSSQSGSDITTFVLVVCLFISCNVLPLTVNFLELLFGIANSYLIDLSNLMVVLNSSCNFIIYFAFGASFRRTLYQFMRSNILRRTQTLKYATINLDTMEFRSRNSATQPLIPQSRLDSIASTVQQPFPSTDHQSV